MSKSEALIQQANDLKAQAAAAMAKPTLRNLHATVALLKGVKAMRKQVDETFDDIIKKAKASYEATRGRKKEYDDPLNEAEATLKKKVDEYYQYEFKVQATAYREAVNEATNAAEDERAAEVKMLQAGGHQAEADHLNEQPLDIIPVPKPEPSKVDGVSIQERWSATVFDEDRLWKFCTDHPEFRHIFKVHGAALNKLATAQKELFKIPGAKAEKKRIVAVKV